jgi:hypothetical protein
LAMALKLSMASTAELVKLTNLAPHQEHGPRLREPLAGPRRMLFFRAMPCIFLRTMPSPRKL